MEGWIKLHRNLLDWEWFNEPKTLSVFIYLLLTARHTPGNWRGHAINIGECLTSRDVISQKTGLTTAEVRTAIKKLQVTNEITIKSTNKFSIVTICNYERYQSGEGGTQPANKHSKGQQTRQQTTNKRPTNDHKQECNTDNTANKSINNPLYIPPNNQDLPMKALLLADGLSEELVNAYMKVRKNKKAPDSIVAYNGLKREADKAGISMETAITECVERNWVGFKAEWYERVRPQPTLFTQQPDRKRAEAEMEEINRRTRAEREERERREAEAARARDKKKILDSIYKQ